MEKSMQLDDLGILRRTHDCGHLRLGDAGKPAVLMGWVARRRDLGALVFVDLRDRGGVTQVVFDQERNEAVYEKAKRLRPEFVIAVTGSVAARAEGMANTEMPTGQVEVLAESLFILNDAQTPPILVHKEEDESDELRMRYRYLDLRRPRMLKNLLLRDRVAFAIREELHRSGFIEVETPTLTSSTPEGARDFLVPSRRSRGRFYALPQSPQLFKQLLMVAGFDRYYQIVKCFRDEDFRADRQPEFTQLDMEMSFITPEDIFAVMEPLMAKVFTLTGVEVEPPFPRLTYREAMERFGTDRPDLRIPVELRDVTEFASGCDFKVFSENAASGGAVIALRVPGGADLSRAKLEGLTDDARKLGAGGLVWLKRIAGSDFKSPALKYLGIDGARQLAGICGLEEGDAMLAVADTRPTAQRALGELRVRLAGERDQITDGRFRFAWITDFPLLEYDEEEGRHVAMHHPFTSPAEQDLDRMESDPLSVRARAYDLVVNGLEVGGGSIRIHRPDIQRRVFSLLGISSDEAAEKFGFLLDALQYGAPPHGGIALGLDRLVMVLAGEASIREVIPFPKTTSGSCPMTGAPSPVDQQQLGELGIRLVRDVE